MPISMQHERDNIYRLEVSGVLKKSDPDRSQAVLVAEIGRIGSTRLLFVLEEFEGWETNPNWSDLTFYAKHGDSIERIAIVGDDRWRDEAMMFAGADSRVGLRWNSSPRARSPRRAPGSPREGPQHRRQGLKTSRTPQRA